MNPQDLLELYQDTLDNFDEMISAGTINAEQYHQLRANAFDEYTAYMADLEGIDFSASEDNVAEFSAGNQFGAALLEYGAEQGYEDAEEYVYDLASHLGVEPDEVVDLISSEYEPDENVVYAVAGSLGLVDESEEDENDYEYEEPEEEYDSAADYRVAELENQLAEFEAEKVVTDALAKLDLKARDLVANGDLPPNAYRLIMGEFNLESDRVAAFSNNASVNGVSIDSEFYALNKTLDIFSTLKLGELGLFNSFVEDEISEFSNNEDYQAEQMAAATFQLRKQKQNGLA